MYIWQYSQQSLSIAKLGDNAFGSIHVFVHSKRSHEVVHNVSPTNPQRRTDATKRNISVPLPQTG